MPNTDKMRQRLHFRDQEASKRLRLVEGRIFVIRFSSIFFFKFCFFLCNFQASFLCEFFFVLHKITGLNLITESLSHIN